MQLQAQPEHPCNLKAKDAGKHLQGHARIVLILGVSPTGEQNTLGKTSQRLSILLGAGKAEQSPPCSSTALHVCLPQNIRGCHPPFISRAARQGRRRCSQIPHAVTRKRGNLEIPSWLPEGVQGNDAFPAGKAACSRQGSMAGSPRGGTLELGERLIHSHPRLSLKKPRRRTELQAGRVSPTAPRWASLG